MILNSELRSRYVRFMPIALAFAGMSKSPRTKVGAVVLGPDQEVRSTGWNGAPRGCRADIDSRRDDRAEKLLWTSHAEENAVANAARHGASLRGCVMVVTHMPCMPCARLIVQSGITAVIAPKPTGTYAERWAQDLWRTKELFRECGVALIETDSLTTAAAPAAGRIPDLFLASRPSEPMFASDLCS